MLDARLEVLTLGPHEEAEADEEQGDDHLRDHPTQEEGADDRDDEQPDHQDEAQVGDPIRLEGGDQHGRDGRQCRYVEYMSSSEPHAVHLTTQGPPGTVLDAEPADAQEALAAALARPWAERRDAISAVVARWPRYLDAWARLGDHARDDVEAYACYRVGYHRGLDRLRANGWRGSGYVRWSAPENRGFLRSLRGLARMATAIDEADEASVATSSSASSTRRACPPRAERSGAVRGRRRPARPESGPLRARQSVPTGARRGGSPVYAASMSTHAVAGSAETAAGAASVVLLTLASAQFLMTLDSR